MITTFSLGIDLGTTSVKVLALDGDGHVLASASSYHGIDSSVDGVQVDPDTWWRSLLRALGELEKLVDLAGACTVGLSGNMSSVVLVDADGRSIAPALLLADQRGGEQLALLPDALRNRIVETTGNAPQTVFALSSLLWWQAHDPATLAAAAVWLSAKDYLRARLTGVLATDPTDAYNSLLLHDGHWDDDLIAALGLAAGAFPRVIPSDAVAGMVSAEASAATGIPQGTPVATGSGDVAAALAGMGGLPGDALAISLGTSATLMVALGGGARPEPPGEAAGMLTIHPASDGTWFALGSLLTGGLALNWLRSIAGPESIAQASGTPDPGDPLVFLPYLAGTGSPDFVSTATGTILGITPSTTSGRIVAALFEAVAFDIAGLVDRVGGGPYSRVVLSGGGGRIPAWPQVIADVLHLPVEILDEPDLSAVGAALYGWHAVGRRVAPAVAATTVQPRCEVAAAWRDRRRRYEAARELALELMRKLLEAERKVSA